MAYIDKIKLQTSGLNIDGSGYVGGSSKTEGDHPYVKGYFYVFFGVPSTIFDDGNNSDITRTQAKEFLLVSAESYTPPGDRTINLQDVQGQGGVDASFITGQTITREFSIQYKDYWGAPIFRIHRQWTSYLNPYLGASTMAVNFSASEYKGACMVIQTKPIVRQVGDTNIQWSADDIIKVDYFDGVQPMTDLKSAYDANITDNSFVKPSVQYKFDGFPLDETNDKVIVRAVEVLNGASLFTKTSKLYNDFANNNNIPV
ncbi:MAG: hypothetical protein DRG78_08390 [Epsilonproteobacteria bacterium]|nr:MAG: hypothetical protein DRG78_08390 [Campylobacterota bacterium]